MKKSHRILVTTAAAAIATIAASTLHMWGPAAAVGQHHPAGDPQAHIEQIAAHLSLTDAQRDALAEPLAELAATLRELHRLHDAIAAELTEDQKAALAEHFHKGAGDRMTAGHHRPPHHGGGQR